MALILRDFFSFAPSASREGGPSSDPDIRKLATAGKGLKVILVASHAGMVNGNHVMYSPRGMKDCSHTWVWPQRKPIQVHHDDHADPIGRIIGARYSGYGESDIAEGQADALNVFKENVLLTKDNVADIAKTLEDMDVLGDAAWRGVGELVLEGIVTDAAAVEKVLDGRYLGVSVTQRPGQAFCSICGQDWVKDGPCDHNRGEKDEESGRSMYLVVGDTEYGELSYVNGPADQHAMGVDAQPIDGISAATMQADEKQTNSSILDRSMQTTVFFQLVDSLEEEIGMTQKNTDKVEDKPIDDKQLDSEENPEEDGEKIADSVASDQEPSKTLEEPPKTKEVDDESDENPETTVEKALMCLFEDRDSLTGNMCDVLFEAMEDLIEEDAKLSPEKRKSLPGSSFCGPNRSFPVNDCDHYTAAKKLLGRYKGPGDKSSILSCVEKKGKALGCSSKKDELENPAEEQDSLGAIENLSDEQLSGLLLDTEKLMADRGLKAERKCDNCSELEAKLSDFESSVPKLQDTVTVLREEWKSVTGEHVAAESSHAKTLARFEDVLKKYLTNILLLTDKEAKTEDLCGKVDGMSLEDMEKVALETDLSEVISFVRSGLTQEPEGTVTPSDADPEEVKVKDGLVKMSESLVNLYKRYGSVHANSCMFSWIRAGKLPEGFTLDKALELVAK